MTIILFEVTSLAFKQIFFVKDQKTLMLSEDQDLIFTTQQQPCHVCHTQAFFHPFLPAFLLRKLTNVSLQLCNFPNSCHDNIFQRIQTSESLGSVFPLFCETKLIFRIIVTGEIVWCEISSILSYSPTILFMVMKHFIKMELLQMYMTSVQELISWVKKSQMMYKRL